MNEVKVCNKCEVEKGLGEFYFDKSKIDGKSTFRKTHEEFLEYMEKNKVA